MNTQTYYELLLDFLAAAECCDIPEKELQQRTHDLLMRINPNYSDDLYGKITGGLNDDTRTNTRA